MIISTCTYWSWDDDSTSVDCLPDVGEVDSAGDFFDENGSQTFGSEFLVDTEEIDLGRGECSACQHRMRGPDVPVEEGREGRTVKDQERAIRGDEGLTDYEHGHQSGYQK